MSMGMNSALKLRSLVDNVTLVLASEILAACQAMEFRKPLQLGEGTRKAYARVRENVLPLDNDREVAPDIQTIARLVQENQVSRLLIDDGPGPN